MSHWKILRLTVNSTYKAETESSWQSEKEYQYDEIKVGDELDIDDFQVIIDAKEEQAIYGTARWHYDVDTFQAGTFKLSESHPEYMSHELNVSFDTVSRITIHLIFHETPFERIRVAIEHLNRDYAHVMPPATASEIDRCNTGLSKYKLPQLPPDYIEFLKITGAFEVNGMQLFGTYGDGIVMQNEMFRQYYHHKEFHSLLIIGRIDDDIYTYNESNGRYEARDINGFEVWDDYKSFYAFFFGEMMKWMR